MAIEYRTRGVDWQGFPEVNIGQVELFLLVINHSNSIPVRKINNDLMKWMYLTLNECSQHANNPIKSVCRPISFSTFCPANWNCQFAAGRSDFTFTAPKMKIGPEPSTQTVPESNATNATFTRTNNTQSLAGVNLDEETVDFLTELIFGWEKVPCTVQKKKKCSEDC